MNIKVDDTVVILKGLEKPQRADEQKPDAKTNQSEARTIRVAMADGTFKEFKKGRVIKIFAEKNKILVEGCNMVYKHMKKSRQNPRGGRLHKEMPVQIANVMLLCPACSKPARTGARTKDGVKYRFCKKCNAEIGTISKKKTVKAAK